jgi:nucleoside phosphorylase
VLKAMSRVSRQSIGGWLAWKAKSAAGEVCLVQTGVGPKRAGDAAAVVAASDRFDLFLSAGCAGALARLATG